MSLQVRRVSKLLFLNKNLVVMSEMLFDMSEVTSLLLRLRPASGGAIEVKSQLGTISDSDILSTVLYLFCLSVGYPSVHVSFYFFFGVCRPVNFVLEYKSWREVTSRNLQRPEPSQTEMVK